MAHDDSEFKELQTLLRLKKYEQPPQGFESYNERFLKEYHRRQRWETSQKTGFARMQEKVGEWMQSVIVPRYAYAAALGVFGAVALAVNGLHSADPVSQIASAAPQATVTAPVDFNPSRSAFALNSQLDFSDLEVQSKLDVGSQVSSGEIQPRYILDARPASYNAGFSF